MGTPPTMKRRKEKDQEEFTAFEEDWTTYESSGSLKRKEWISIIIWIQRIIEQCAKACKPTPAFRCLRRNKEMGRKEEMNPEELLLQVPPGPVTLLRICPLGLAQIARRRKRKEEEWFFRYNMIVVISTLSRAKSKSEKMMRTTNTPYIFLPTNEQQAMLGIEKQGLYCLWNGRYNVQPSL